MHFISYFHHRLKTADLEIKRYRMRLTAFRERVAELEQAAEPLRAENERLQRHSEKIEGLKATIGRKEALLKNYRDQADRSKADFDSLKQLSEFTRLEYEKKLRYDSF